MCWVMPPASPAATSVSRIASSSDVLPWSTWPMIVTTGGRVDRGPRRRPRTPARRRPRRPRGRSRSPCRTRPRAPGSASSDSVWVSVAISPSCISFLMISGTGDAEVLGDVLDGRAGVDLDDVGLRGRETSCGTGSVVGAAPAPAAAARRAALRAAAGPPPGHRRAAAGPPAARGLGVDDDAAHAAGRAGGALALQRGARRAGAGRRLPSPRLAVAPSALGAAGLPASAWARRPRAGARRGRGCRGRRAARSCGALAAACGLAPFALGCFLPVSAASASVLVDGGGRRLDLDAGAFEPLRSPRRWACCTAWLARGRASLPCVSEVYGLVRDGHRRSEGPVEARGGRRAASPAVLSLVQPGAATGEPGLADRARAPRLR